MSAPPTTSARFTCTPIDEPLGGADADPAAARAVLEWALADFAGLPAATTGRTATRAELDALFARPAPEVGRPFADVLRDFADHVAPHVFRPNHPRFLAFIPGAPAFPAVLGDWLATTLNAFAAVWFEASGPAAVELAVIDWFCRWFDYPPESGGLLTSGGSDANLTALLTARERLPFAERRRAVLYVSAQRHWSNDRAAWAIGLHRDQVRPVSLDAELRMAGLALADAVRRDRADGLLPWAVVANGGATNTGTVDDFATLADVCAAERLWLHADAAFGGPAVLSAGEKPWFAGIERADSITLDPHKWLAQPFACGCLLLRDVALLPAAFANRPDYMQDVEPADGEVNFADYGLALTRPFRALKLWCSLQTLGVGWFRQLIERSCALADYAERVLTADPRFEVVCGRRLSIVCFRAVPAGVADLDGFNLELLARSRATGQVFLSSTRLDGKVALRFCFVNWRTTRTDVDAVVRLLGDLLTSG